jgi:hypothetical protein
VNTTPTQIIRAGRVPAALALSWFALYAAVIQAQPPAQVDAADTPAPVQPATATPLAEEKMDKFAEAYVAVESIQTRAAQQLSTAPDADAANAVKSNAETEMVKAVERNGLQVEEFNEIVQAMVADNALRTKVIGKIEQRRRG